MKKKVLAIMFAVAICLTGCGETNYVFDTSKSFGTKSDKFVVDTSDMTPEKRGMKIQTLINGVKGGVSNDPFYINANNKLYYECIFMNENSVPEMVVYDGNRSFMVIGGDSVLFEAGIDDDYPATIWYKEGSGCFVMHKILPGGIYVDSNLAFHDKDGYTERLGVYKTDGEHYWLNDTPISEEEYKNGNLVYQGYQELIPRYNSVEEAIDATGIEYVLPSK